jgi:hypothetical protein
VNESNLTNREYHQTTEMNKQEGREQMPCKAEKNFSNDKSKSLTLNNSFEHKLINLPN